MTVRAQPGRLGSVFTFTARRPEVGAQLPFFSFLPRDIALFVKSARTDSKIARLLRESGPRAAFETTYSDSDDPWASASPRYRYQRLKYDKLLALLPLRRFTSALDLGCGLGLLSQKLARHADSVLGLDIAAAAIDHARRRASGFENLRTRRHSEPARIAEWQIRPGCRGGRALLFVSPRR
jgi:SAM-dependent methyltransferase